MPEPAAPPSRSRPTATLVALAGGVAVLAALSTTAVVSERPATDNLRASLVSTTLGDINGTTLARSGDSARSLRVGVSVARDTTERRPRDGINAYRLADHLTAVRYGRSVRMWDCWTVGTRPRFSAWNGRRWVLWSVGETSTDRDKCEDPGTQKVVYDYDVTLLGRAVRARAYRLLRVKEHCRGCETSAWTLPVLPPGAAAD